MNSSIMQAFVEELYRLSEDSIKEAAKKKSKRQTRQDERVGTGLLVGGGAVASPIARNIAQSTSGGLLGTVADVSSGYVSASEDQLRGSSPELYRQFKSTGGASSAPGLFPYPGAHMGRYNDPTTGAFKKYVHIPKANSPAVMAHELGHGTGLMDNKGYRNLYDMGRSIQDKTKRVRNLASMGGAALAGASALDLKDDETNERNMRYARNLSLASMIPEAPQLFEEARATKRAVQYAPKGKKLKYLAQLAPAYGTYLAGNLGIPAATAAAAEYGRRKFKKRKESKKK